VKIFVGHKGLKFGIYGQKFAGIGSPFFLNKTLMMFRPITI
jgi:hypothetical protein